MAELQTNSNAFCVSYAEELGKKLGVSTAVALGICYLRSRSRWTQEKEDEIIRRAKEGNPIDGGDILSGEF
jgi:hypothetical protein